MNQITPRALSTDQAASYCGISESKLKKARMRSSGSKVNSAPRHTMLGKRVVYLVDDLDAWLESQRSATPISSQSEVA